MASITIDYHLMRNMAVAILAHNLGYRGMQCSYYGVKQKRGLLCLLVSSKFSDRMLATDTDSNDDGASV